jgi:positive regulator of sigma E activity
MREQGQIVRVEKDKLVVKMDAGSGCHSCGLNHCCHSIGGSGRELTLRNPGGSYKPGDTVEIEISPRSVLTAAFLVFLLPLILSVSVYVLVYQSTRNTGYGLLAFFISFGLSEALVAGIDRLVGRKSYFQPRIIGQSTDSKPV